MSKVDSFHSYLQATKDMAQSVVHRYHTCDEEPNVAWEIIEDIMEGLIAVFLDMFYDGKGEPLDKGWVEFAGRKVPTMKVSPYLTESDVEKDIDSTNERIDELEATVEQLLSGLEQERDARERLEKKVNELKKAMWDRFDIVDGDILRISREVSDQKKSINNLDFKNGEYDAQFINLTDEQNNLGTRLSLVENKVKALARHCNIIFTE